MSDYYKDFLRRLIQYRLRFNLTQEAISEALGITQSQLSKQELGKTIVPYKILVSLMKMGWDVDYLLTGKESKCEPSELTEILKGTSDIYYKPMLEFITWLLAVEIEKSVSGMGVEEKCELSILKGRISTNVNESIMYEIRKTVGVAQVAMAEKLGVNIKKYRALEKLQVYPDAELLLEIYLITGCKPSLFLSVDYVENVIIDNLWEQVEIEKRKEILAIVSSVEQFMKL